MAFNTNVKKDVSYKLRSDKLNVKNSDTKKLAQESRKMEERLSELKMAMDRDKETRQNHHNQFWEKGQKGVLGTYATSASKQAKKATKDQDNKSAKKVRRVTVLKDEPIVLPKKEEAKPGTMAFIAKKSTTNGKRIISKDSNRCGQCENKLPQISCAECEEDYCKQCFSAFHLKGALRKHHHVPYNPDRNKVKTNSGKVVSFSEKDNSEHLVQRRDDSSSVRDRSNTVRSDIRRAVDDTLYAAAGPRDGSNNTTASTLGWAGGGASEYGGGATAGYAIGGGGLLDGEYDERAQADSFAAAVSAWREKKQSVLDGDEGGDTRVLAACEEEEAEMGHDVVGAGPPHSGGGGLLLNGEFNEEANAASFADALADWRGKKQAMLADNQRIKNKYESSQEVTIQKPSEKPLKNFTTTSVSTVAISAGEINDQKHREHILQRIELSASRAVETCDPGTTPGVAAAAGGVAEGGAIGGGDMSISYFERIMLKKNRREVNNNSGENDAVNKPQTYHPGGARYTGRYTDTRYSNDARIAEGSLEHKEEIDGGSPLQASSGEGASADSGARAGQAVRVRQNAALADSRRFLSDADCEATNTAIRMKPKGRGETLASGGEGRSTPGDIGRSTSGIRERSTSGTKEILRPGRGDTLTPSPPKTKSPRQQKLMAEGKSSSQAKTKDQTQRVEQNNNDNNANDNSRISSGESGNHTFRMEEVTTDSPQTIDEYRLSKNKRSSNPIVSLAGEDNNDEMGGNAVTAFNFSAMGSQLFKKRNDLESGRNSVNRNYQNVKSLKQSGMDMRPESRMSSSTIALDDDDDNTSQGHLDLDATTPRPLISRASNHYTASRPATSRASCRPSSAAGQKSARKMSAGILTRGPSQRLVDIARLQPSDQAEGLPPYSSSSSTAKGAGHTTGTAPFDDAAGSLASFFAVGVAPPPFVERTLTPRKFSSAATTASATTTSNDRTQEKWKIDNKIYQMAPKSWRPAGSIATIVGSDRLADAVQENRERVANFLSDDNAPPPDTPLEAWTDTCDNSKLLIEYPNVSIDTINELPGSKTNLDPELDSARDEADLRNIFAGDDAEEGGDGDDVEAKGLDYASETRGGDSRALLSYEQMVDCDALVADDQRGEELPMVATSGGNYGDESESDEEEQRRFLKEMRSELHSRMSERERDGLASRMSALNGDEDAVQRYLANGSERLSSSRERVPDDEEQEEEQWEEEDEEEGGKDFDRCQSIDDYLREDSVESYEDALDDKYQQQSVRELL